jgi:hypothetical protein
VKGETGARRPSRSPGDDCKRKALKVSQVLKSEVLQSSFCKAGPQGDQGPQGIQGEKGEFVIKVFKVSKVPQGPQVPKIPKRQVPKGGIGDVQVPKVSQV